MKTKNIILLALSLISVSVLEKSLHAEAVSSIPNEYPSLYKGTRPLGMGTAFIAMPGTDENAPFYNPAAINDYEKKLHFRFLSPTTDFSVGAFGLISDVVDLADSVDAASTDGAKIDVFRDFVDNHIGQFESVGVTLPAVQVQHQWISATILADSRTTISFRNRAFTNIELNSRSDFGGIIGTAYNFKESLGIDENVQVGLNLKVLHRLSINEIISADDIINNSDFDAAVPRKRGTGVGVDLGIKADIPTLTVKALETLKPTVALTYQDIGNTRFTGDVPDTQQSLSFGFAVHPTVKKWQFHIENDFRELNQGTNFMKKWDIGAEVMTPKLGNFFQASARIGGHQGYLSAGATLDFRYAKLEFATYGEEASATGTHKQLRRVATNLSFGF